MPSVINVSIGVEFPGGLSVKTEPKLPVQAYDRVEVPIGKDPSPKVLEAEAAVKKAGAAVATAEQNVKKEEAAVTAAGENPAGEGEAPTASEAPTPLDNARKDLEAKQKELNAAKQAEKQAKEVEGIEPWEEDVHVQPSELEEVEFVLIRVTNHSDENPLYGDKLSYQVVSTGAAQHAPVFLDRAQIFMGEAVKLLGVAPKTLHIRNATDRLVVLEILVGRNAIARQ